MFTLSTTTRQTTAPPGADFATAEKIPPAQRAPPQAGKPTRAISHRLWPDPLDQVPGNAAPLWLRAGLAARLANTGKQRWTEKEWKWLGSSETALKDLPRKEVREFLRQ